MRLFSAAFVITESCATRYQIPSDAEMVVNRIAVLTDCGWRHVRTVTRTVPISTAVLQTGISLSRLWAFWIVCLISSTILSASVFVGLMVSREIFIFCAIPFGWSLWWCGYGLFWRYCLAASSLANVLVSPGLFGVLGLEKVLVVGVGLFGLWIVNPIRYPMKQQVIVITSAAMTSIGLRFRREVRSIPIARRASGGTTSVRVILALILTFFENW